MNRFACLPALLLLAACNPQQAVPPQNPGQSGTPTVAAAPHSVVNWSPQSIEAGGSFNVQRDGNSGISFELDRPVPPGDILVAFDGKPLTGVAASGVIVTATIPPAYLASAGKFPVTLTLPGSAATVQAGTFEVK